MFKYVCLFEGDMDVYEYGCLFKYLFVCVC